jgi:hypothetical protein
MSDVTNADRAGWARTALDAYVDETRSPCASAYELTPENKDNNEEVIGDFLCDLRHLCDALGLDWESLNDSGAMHYRDEAEEARQEAEEEAGNVKCHVCSEPIHRAALSRVWVHGHGAAQCGTGDGATAYPAETGTTTDEIMDLITPDPWGQAGGK